MLAGSFSTNYLMGWEKNDDDNNNNNKSLCLSVFPILMCLDKITNIGRKSNRTTIVRYSLCFVCLFFTKLLHFI